jgi:diguanylate cyclase (GGDEF)-like protein
MQTHRLTPALHTLETADEAEFDALTRIAALALNAPIVSISVMDSQRQRIQSHAGLEMPEIGHDNAFCAHKLSRAGGNVLVIPDLLDDARFALHPWVTDAPGLRFYAGMPLADASGAVLGTIAVFDTRPRSFDADDRATLHDIATMTACALRSHQQAHQLKHLAMTDQLTGLVNRAHFERTLEAEFGRAVRVGEPFTLLLLDLDGFKAVNDGFGLGAGDETLKEVSERLLTQMRAGDVLARLGGDEFGIVMRDGSTEAAQALAKRIVRAVSQPVRLSSGDEVGVGASVGMAAYADDVLSVRKLVSQANQALYEAKQQNARRWKMFVGMRA